MRSYYLLPKSFLVSLDASARLVGGLVRPDTVDLRPATSGIVEAVGEAVNLGWVGKRVHFSALTDARDVEENLIVVRDSTDVFGVAPADAPRTVESLNLAPEIVLVRPFAPKKRAWNGRWTDRDGHPKIWAWVLRAHPKHSLPVGSMVLFSRHADELMDLRDERHPVYALPVGMVNAVVNPPLEPMAP